MRGYVAHFIRHSELLLSQFLDCSITMAGNMATIVGVHASSSPDAPIFGGKKSYKNRSAFCVWDDYKKTAHWLTGAHLNIASVQSAILNKGGLNRAAMSLGVELDDLPGDGTYRKMKEVPLGRQPDYFSVEVSIGQPGTGTAMRRLKLHRVCRALRQCTAHRRYCAAPNCCLAPKARYCPCQPSCFMLAIGSLMLTPASPALQSVTQEAY